MLSDNGVEIIDRENKEQEVKNILTATIYVDSITGAFTDSYIEEKTKKRGSVIHLNSNVDLNEDNIEDIINIINHDVLENLRIQDYIYSFNYSIEKIEVIRDIPFNILYRGNELC